MMETKIKEPITIPEACGYQLCVIDILNYINDHLKTDNKNIDAMDLKKYVSDKYDSIKSNVEKL